MQLTLDQIQAALDAIFYQAKPAQKSTIKAVCRDTADVTEHSLFVCIIGQNFDGHDFAKHAAELGASALLVSRHLPEINVAQFVVKDTVKALGKLANVWRNMFRGKVIGITGSAGKTTLKESLAQVLEHAGKKVSKNKLNYNNQVGLPLSMLSASGAEDYWVMEAGISKAQDMDELGTILEPDLALVLNVGAAHTEGLGEKGVAWHKAQLLKYLKPENFSKGFVCADYVDLVQEAKKICPEITFFSAQDAEQSTYKANYLGMESKNKQGKYNLKYAEKNYEILSPFFGNYGAENVAAIAAVTDYLGLSEQKIIEGIQNIHLPEQRFNVHEFGPWCVIDDSYNANALSMQRMLDAAVQKANGGPCYAVLGAMGELGSLAQEEHEALGRYLAKAPIEKIFWKGPYAKEVLKGLNINEKFIVIDNAHDFKVKWQDANLSAGTVLCKGSRSNALEEIVTIICNTLKTKAY